MWGSIRIPCGIPKRVLLGLRDNSFEILSRPFELRGKESLWSLSLNA